MPDLNMFLALGAVSFAITAALAIAECRVLGSRLRVAEAKTRCSLVVLVEKGGVEQMVQNIEISSAPMLAKFEGGKMPLGIYQLADGAIMRSYLVENGEELNLMGDRPLDNEEWD